MTDPTISSNDSADDTSDDVEVSAPGSEQRRRNLAEALADVEAGARAEVYDTDGENTEA